MQIPSLLRTVSQQQDVQPLNVDLTFSQNQVEIHKDFVQVFKSDPVESLRTKRFKEMSMSPEKVPKFEPVEQKETQTDYEPSKPRLTSQLRGQKAAAMQQSSISFNYYGKPDLKRSVKRDGNLSYLQQDPQKPQPQRISLKYEKEKSVINEAIAQQMQPVDFKRTKQTGLCNPKQREFDLAAPWRAFGVQKAQTTGK